MQQILAAAQPDVVIHLASNFIAEHKSGDVDALIRDNVLFGAELLEAMRLNPVRRIVNIGSAWQHYRNAEYSATSLYAATKQAFVSLLGFYAEAYALSAVTIEFTDTYGPGDTRRKLIPFMLAAEAAGTEMAMVPADVPIDFVHIDDALEAIRVAVARTAELAVRPTAALGAHERFAIRSGVAMDMQGLFDLWADARGRRVAAKFGARACRAREMLEPWTEGEVLPGWSPRVGLREGLRSL